MRPFSCCLLVGGLFTLGLGPASGAAPPRPARVDVLGDPLPSWAVARMGTSRYRLTSSRQTMTLAPDGKTLAILGPERDQVILLDTVTGREITRFAAPARDGLVFLRRGRELACAAAGNIVFWDLTRGKESRRIPLKSEEVEVAALAAEGGLMAAGPRSFGRKAPLLIHEVQTGRQIATLEPDSTQSHAVFSPDGRWLATWAVGSESGRGRPGSSREGSTRGSQTVPVWDPTTGKVVCKIDAGPGESTAAVAFAPDRKTLALATTSGGVQLWDVLAGKRLKSWRAALRSSSARECLIAFSPDSKILVVGARGSDSPPLVWDLTTGRRLPPVRAPECRFHSVGFPGPGQVVALGLQSQAVLVWDLLKGRRLGDTVGHTAAITALSFRADGQRLFSAAADGVLIEWDLKGKELRRVAPPRSSPPRGGMTRRPGSMTSAIESFYSGQFSPCGTYLASSGRDAGIAVRDVESGQDVLTLSSGFRSGSYCFAFSRRGNLLAFSSSESRRNGVRLFRMESGEELPAYDTEGTPSTALAFDPTGQRLAVALDTRERTEGSQGEVRLYRIDREEEDADFTPFELPALLGTVSSLTYSPDGKILVVARAQGIHLLDAASGEEVGLLDVDGSLSTAPAFSPDGRTLAVGSTRMGKENLLALWEVASSKKRWTVPVAAPLSALAFSPSGKLLAAGSRDGSVLLWDLSGQLAGLTGMRPDACWADLLGDAPRAFTAQRALAAGMDASVALLRKHVRPVAGKPLDADTLARLIEQLDDDDYALRRKAFALLAAEGRSADAALRKALADKPSAEVKRRVKELLTSLGRPGATGETLRDLRALEVLEWIGTPAARRLIEELTRGRADAPLTRDAMATLARMPR